MNDILLIITFEVLSIGGIGLSYILLRRFEAKVALEQITQFICPLISGKVGAVKESILFGVEEIIIEGEYKQRRVSLKLRNNRGMLGWGWPLSLVESLEVSIKLNKEFFETLARKVNKKKYIIEKNNLVYRHQFKLLSRAKRLRKYLTSLLEELYADAVIVEKQYWI